MKLTFIILPHCHGTVMSACGPRLRLAQAAASGLDLSRRPQGPWVPAGCPDSDPGTVYPVACCRASLPVSVSAECHGVAKCNGSGIVEL
eukprot:2810512-Rhodomonas_salina.1